MAVLFERFQRRQNGEFFLRGGHRRETIAAADRLGEFLEAQFFEARFVVEEVDLGRAAALPEENHAFGLGREMREAVAGGGECGEGVGVEQRCERGGADAGGAAAEKLAASELQVSFAERVHDLVSASSRLSSARQTAV